MLRLSKHTVTELEHVSYENRLAKSKAHKNAMFKTVCPTCIFIDIFSCHEPEIECKAIPYQV